MSEYERILEEIKKLRSDVCAGVDAGGCVEVRTLKDILTGFSASQTAINERTKELIVEIYGNGKAGLKQQLMDQKHELQDMRGDVNAGFKSIQEEFTRMKEVQEKEKEVQEKKTEEKTVTWKWLREKVSVPLIMAVLLLLVELIVKRLTTG